LNRAKAVIKNCRRSSIKIAKVVRKSFNRRHFLTLLELAPFFHCVMTTFRPWSPLLLICCQAPQAPGVPTCTTPAGGRGRCRDIQACPLLLGKPSSLIQIINGTVQFRMHCALIKKNIKFSLYIRKFRMGQLQSHI
jgi:hypothetical protein